MDGNTKAVGDESESMVLAECVAAGWSVSIPFGDNDSYDLVLDDGTALYRVQCKTAWRNKPETIRFNTHSQTTRDGKYHETTYEGAVDAFVVHFPETGSCTGSTWRRGRTRRWSCGSTRRSTIRRSIGRRTSRSTRPRCGDGSAASRGTPSQRTAD